MGVVTPRLLSSSGNEELDVIALNTSRQWQFRPAESDHVAIDSKVRLRILFEVK
jgi:TonB family protein